MCSCHPWVAEGLPKALPKRFWELWQKIALAHMYVSVDLLQHVCSLAYLQSSIMMCVCVCVCVCARGSGFKILVVVVIAVVVVGIVVVGVIVVMVVVVGMVVVVVVVELALMELLVVNMAAAGGVGGVGGGGGRGVGVCVCVCVCVCLFVRADASLEPPLFLAALCCQPVHVQLAVLERGPLRACVNPRQQIGIAVFV